MTSENFPKEKEQKPESAFYRRKNYGNGNRKELKKENTIKA
jgi:hypothetical protein